MPLLSELAGNDRDRKLLTFVSAETAISRALVTTPGVPAERVEALRRAVYARSLPDKIVRRLSPAAPLPPHHPAAGKGLVNGKPALYVCRNMACEAPVTDPEQVVLHLGPQSL